MGNAVAPIGDSAAAVTVTGVPLPLWPPLLLIWMLLLLMCLLWVVELLYDYGHDYDRNWQSQPQARAVVPIEQRAPPVSLEIEETVKDGCRGIGVWYSEGQGEVLLVGVAVEAVSNSRWVVAFSRKVDVQDAQTETLPRMESWQVDSHDKLVWMHENTLNVDESCSLEVLIANPKPPRSYLAICCIVPCFSISLWFCLRLPTRHPSHGNIVVDADHALLHMLFNKKWLVALMQQSHMCVTGEPSRADGSRRVLQQDPGASEASSKECTSTPAHMLAPPHPPSIPLLALLSPTQPCLS